VSDDEHTILVACVFALLTLLLVSCARPPITQQHRDAFSMAERGWHAAGLPDPNGCLDGARVEQATSWSDYRYRCYLYGPYSHIKAAGCLSRYARGAFGRRDGVLVLVAPNAEASAYLIVHESMHALTRCAMDRGHADPFDGLHTDARVWTAAGGKLSAQHLSGATP